jgi:hypothetical protein
MVPIFRLPIPRPFHWQVFVILLIGCLVGLIAIIPYALTLQAPTLANIDLPMPLEVLIPIQIAQQLVIFGAILGLGLFCATRIGLGLPFLEAAVEGRPYRERMVEIVFPAMIVAVACSVFIVVVQILISPAIIREMTIYGVKMPENITPPPWQGFLASFYGGIVEEALLRLGLMTMLAWAGSRLSHTSEGYPTQTVLWVANVVAALVFGLGHLPASTAAGMPVTFLLVTQIVTLNSVAGMAFGWLYARYGLECAMLAHFLTDIGLHVIAAFFIK